MRHRTVLYLWILSLLAGCVPSRDDAQAVKEQIFYGENAIFSMAGHLDFKSSMSISVAGSLPYYLRARDMVSANPLGDYEQKVPEFYRIANYLELYIMGSYGDGRSQLQILNEFDACCFRGTGFRTYKDIVINWVQSLGAGSYDVFLDSTHRLHQISPKALEVIFEFLENH